MKAPKPNYTRQLPPIGNHVARLINIVYLGTQHSPQYGDTFKLRLTWELPNEKAVFKENEGEKPFVVSKETSLSMGTKSALRPIDNIKVLSFEKWDDEFFNKLPEFIRTKITQSKEYKEMKEEKVEEISLDDVPFD